MSNQCCALHDIPDLLVEFTPAGAEEGAFDCCVWTAVAHDCDSACIYNNISTVSVPTIRFHIRHAHDYNQSVKIMIEKQRKLTKPPHLRQLLDAPRTVSVVHLRERRIEELRFGEELQGLGFVGIWSMGVGEFLEGGEEVGVGWDIEEEVVAF